MKQEKYKTFDELPLMLSVPELASVLGISRAGAYELVKEKGFPSLTIGSRILTHSDDHQWNLVYAEETWWHVDVSNVDVRASDRRASLTVLHEESEMQGSAYRQSQPQLTELAKELMVPGSTK